MQALVLNSLDPQHELYDSIKRHVFKELSHAGYKCKVIDLVDKHIEYCNGCGYCGEKEVGVCVKKDDMVAIYPGMANAEIYVFISTISFGGFDSEMKKVIDRLSPMGLAYYKIHRGEIHHGMRYDNLRVLCSIGIMDHNDLGQETTFKLITERLEKAFFASKSEALVLTENDHLEHIHSKIGDMFKKMEMMV